VQLNVTITHKVQIIKQFINPKLISHSFHFYVFKYFFLITHNYNKLNQMTMAAELTLNITTTKVHCHRRSSASSINLPFSPRNSLKLFSDLLMAFLGVQMPPNISICMPVSQSTAIWPAHCSVLAVIILTTAGDLYTHSKFFVMQYPKLYTHFILLCLNTFLNFVYNTTRL